jgi:hypothetical protein|tara:strand:- start:329 stop:631 length:303 start_codon:yes stop_codon:yes gene_type:complete
MQDIDFKLGDIIRWRDSKMSLDYDYGMVIKEPHAISGGTYSVVDHLADIADFEGSTFVMSEPILALSVFSFAAQKVVIIYKNPEDLPLFIEKVDFYEKNP